MAIYLRIVLLYLMLPPGCANASPAKRVSVSSVNSGAIVLTGVLKTKLGKIVTIRGAFVSDYARRRKADMGKTLFAVQRVNDKHISKTIIALRLPNQMLKNKPKPGAKAALLGYETGGMLGAPSGLFKHVPAFTTTGYHFGTYFSVIKPVTN